MQKIALVMAAFGFVAFAGVARADKAESSDKTDQSTTLTGKHKTTHTKKIDRADGSSLETKSVTTVPKNDDDRATTDKRADRADRRDDRADKRDADHGADVKTTDHTTLSGKREIKTTKKLDNADGSQTETTTTKTEPKR
jgi:hypothetical protein